jgi:hypothetical protein
VALLDLEDGSMLARTRLHGPVAQLLNEGDALYAVTELGDHLRWDLASLRSDYCSLLQDVWSQVPVVWEQGKPSVRKPPAEHRCID